MSTDYLSRGNIPDQLLTAKRAASTQFLTATQPPTLLSAFAVSTRPEDNVVGVGIGRKVTDGKVTDQSAIRIYVVRKVAKDAIPDDFLVPGAIGGVQTDVVETGRFEVQPALVPMPQRRLRPAKPGCSVGFRFTGSMAQYVMAGTFGAVVESGGARYILSNNHVLANENALPLGSPIFQPGLMDHGDVAQDQIARLTRFIAISAAHPNAVDCAIAEVADPKTVRATFLPKVGRLKSPNPIDAVEGMQVHKIGRTTGYTRGVVFDVSADVSIRFDLGVVVFQDQVLIRGDRGKFSDHGDSGSVIVDRASGRAMGLLFAGSGGVAPHTIANHMSDVLGQLAVNLVT